MSFRTQRNRIIRKKLSDWLDSLPSGYQFTIHELTKIYDKQPSSLASILKEFSGDKIDRVIEHGSYSNYHPAVYVKL